MTGFRRTATALLVLAVLVAGGIVAANHFGIARPVSQSLEEGYRTPFAVIAFNTSFSAGHLRRAWSTQRGAGFARVA